MRCLILCLAVLLLGVAGCHNGPDYGPLMPTGRPLDVAIAGNGYLIVSNDHEVLYTRFGQLFVESTGELAVELDRGYILQPLILVPPGSNELTIASDGVVTVLVPGESTPRPIGRIGLATFLNPAGLQRVREHLRRPTRESGPAEYGIPGEAYRGRLLQGYLEEHEP
jgi:flagellar basal-body rod protein FlgG